MTLYFVIKQGGRYAVLETTAEQMYARISADPTLTDSLDRSPFKTRSEAEKRRDELNSGFRSSSAHS